MFARPCVVSCAPGRRAAGIRESSVCSKATEGHRSYWKIVSAHCRQILSPPSYCVCSKLMLVLSLPTSSSYIGPEFPKVLEQPNVEYRQANLMVAGPFIASPSFTAHFPSQRPCNRCSTPRQDTTVSTTFSISRERSASIARMLYAQLLHFPTFSLIDC